VLYAIFLTLFLGLIFSGSALADKNLGLPPLTIPIDNPRTAEKIALGRLRAVIKTGLLMPKFSPYILRSRKKPI
jgi:hypothetical protein